MWHANGTASMFVVLTCVALVVLAVPTARGQTDAAGTAPPPLPPVPNAQQLTWQEIEYYAFIHFGMNTFTDREWGDGKEEPRLFNPTALDARQWAKTCKDAGMKMIIMTAKHHDGFCLWPSKYTEHSVKNSPWRGGKGDVVRELSDACRESGLKFGIYLSPWDRHERTYGDSPKYNEYFKNQLTELLTNYGEVTVVWFDGACGEGPNGKRQEYDWPAYYAVVRKHQPNALIAICGPDIRWVGNESGVARETEWSVQPPPDVALKEGQVRTWHPAECDVSIRPGWFYHPVDDRKVKPLDHLLDIYYSSVGRNASLLLNLPPDRRGLIHQNDVRRLLELRKVLDATFARDLARGKAAKAGNVRGGNPAFGADRAVDGKKDTCWATDDDVTRSWIEVDLGQATTFNRVMIQEDIRLGQRVEAFTIEAWDGSQWKPVSQGTTIGYKRLLRFPDTTAARVRLTITKARACPTIAALSVFHYK